MTFDFDALKNNDRILAWLYAISVFFPMISYYSSTILKSYGFSTTTVFAYSIAFISSLFSYLFCLKRNISPIIFLLIFSFLYVVTIAIWPQNREFMFGKWLDACYNPFYYIFVFGIPLVFIPCSMQNVSKLEKPLFFLSFVNVFFGILGFVFVVVNHVVYEYMTFSYNMLLGTCLLFAFSVKERKILLVCFAILGAICVMLIGSRGAMVSVVLFFFLYFVLKYVKTMVGFVVSFFLLIGLFLVADIFFIEIMGVVNQILAEIDFKSRVVELILNNEFEHSRGRAVIREILSNAISESPIVGYGIFGDRAIFGSYAHNFFLEIFVAFGIPIGIVLSSLWVFMLAFALIYSRKNPFLFAFFVPVASAVIFRLMVSSSFLVNPHFYMMMGGVIICIKDFNERKLVREFL